MNNLHPESECICPLRHVRTLRIQLEEKTSVLKVSETCKMVPVDDAERSINECKEELHKEYEINTKDKIKEEEIELMWREKLEKIIQEKDSERETSLQLLREEWNKERKELERLTQFATSAFKSGTESVDLLKKQVSAQRKELDEAKRNHKHEIGELQALLEVKRRKGGKSAGEVKLGGALEDSAEFEYLRNILYQYMLGKETQTLAKVLCAVVKFSQDQQTHILEYEEQKQSIVNTFTNGLGI